METIEEYETYTFDEGIQNVSHEEEICEPIEECVLSDNITDFTIEEEVYQEDVDEEVTMEVIEEEQCLEEIDEQNDVICIKKEASQFNSGDESTAVEALQKLGGMCCFEEKKINCPTCSNTFTATELIKHQNTTCSTPKHACSFCGDKFMRKIELKNHMVCHMIDRPHACRTCGNLFKTKAKLQAHITEVHQIEKPHKCPVCLLNFQRPSSLSNHMKIHNYKAGRALMQANNTCEGEKNATDNQNVQILTKIESIQNLELPQGPWTTVQIAMDSGSIEELAIRSDNVETMQELTVLPNGEVAHVTEYTIENSVEGSTNSNGEIENAFVKINKPVNEGHTCDECGVSFARVASLTMHIKKTHPKSEFPSPVECKFCDRLFQDATFLANHQNACTKKLMKSSGTNEKFGKHACTDCGKKFTTKQKMFRHQWIHRKKTFSCEICGTQFETQKQLDDHRLSSHPAGTPFTCKKCGKSFVSRQGLWEHDRTHAGSPAHFQCDVCSKTFSSRQGYLIHHRTHTGERPYGCKFCWKAFRDGGTLRKHERIHTGERPHVCPLCKKSFNQKVVLREHIRWVHAAGKNDPELTGPPFPCPLCEILTQDRDELCAHIVKHSDQMIAEAKAKSNNVTVKVKVSPKKKVKTTEVKQPKTPKVPKTPKNTTKGQKTRKQTKKITNSSKLAETRSITVEEQHEALLSITKESEEQQETYIIVKDEYNDQQYCLQYDELSGETHIEGSSEPINVIAISRSDENDENDDNDEFVEEIVENTDNDDNETDYNTMHLIPYTTESGKTVYIDKNTNTLHFITKQNENLPLVIIPNTENNDDYTDELCDMNVETSIGIQEEEIEEEHVENMTVGPVLIVKRDINSDNEQDDSEDDSEGLLCSICGHEFKNKAVLMEHVKIHI